MLPDLSWVHSIENILSYLDTYLKVMNYFKKKYPNIIFDVNLEDISNESEQITKQIFNFCGLKWEKEILNFYKRNDLYSKTLSLKEIRSKVKKYDPQKYKPYYSLLDAYKDKYNWLNF